MKLTAFTDFSLRVLIYVAAHEGDRVTIAEIARAYEISENRLTKVVHSLGRAGFLANARGHDGGFALARPPNAIRIGAVVRHGGGDATPAACFESDGPRCSIEQICRLHGVFQKAVEVFYGVRDECTLEDVMRNQPELKKVLLASPRHDDGGR